VVILYALERGRKVASCRDEMMIVRVGKGVSEVGKGIWEEVKQVRIIRRGRERLDALQLST
jgi:hypothetical protein